MHLWCAKIGEFVLCYGRRKDYFQKENRDCFHAITMRLKRMNYHHAMSTHYFACSFPSCAGKCFTGNQRDD